MSIAFQKVAAISSPYSLYFGIFKGNQTEYTPVLDSFCMKKPRNEFIMGQKSGQVKSGKRYENSWFAAFF